MNIGEFKKNGSGVIAGYIATAAMDLPRLALRPVVSANDRAPAFEIVASNPGKRWVQIGALWEAVSNSTGEIFLQGQIDDPSLPGKLPIALFAGDEDSYRVAWNRPQRRDDMLGTRRPSPVATASTGEGAAGGIGEDEIPF